MGALEGFRAKVLNRFFSANYGERFAHKREKMSRHKIASSRVMLLIEEEDVRPEIKYCLQV